MQYTHLHSTPTVNDEHPLTGKDVTDIMKWLDLIELRSVAEVKERLTQFVADDAMSEM
jgi:hypothetical protein